jgi:hypothetical protein
MSPPGAGASGPAGFAVAAGRWLSAPMRIAEDGGIWLIVFAALVLAVICDGIGVWMGWMAMH